MDSYLRYIRVVSQSMQNKTLGSNSSQKFPKLPPPDGLFHTFDFSKRHESTVFRGRASKFNQSEARKQCFLDSDWLEFVTLPRKYRTP